MKSQIKNDMMRTLFLEPLPVNISYFLLGISNDDLDTGSVVSVISVPDKSNPTNCYLNAANGT